MFARFRRTVSVLAIVVAGYVAYALVAVPFIEPNIKFVRKNRSSPPPIARARKLDHLFQAGSWELERPMAVEIDQGTLLFADYTPLPKGQLKLEKCTLIAYIEDSPQPTAEPPTVKRERRPIIIRASSGATLDFGEKLNVLKGEFGPLRGGTLNGEITIQCPASGPGTEDNLELVTKNVQIARQKIWTPHPVRFRYGPNSGSGQGLTIHLATSVKSHDDNSGLKISGVRSFELERLERMELVLQNQGLFGRQKPLTAPAPGLVEKNPATPVEVKCRGPLQFDVDRQLISLEDQVELVRRHPNGATDQLNCQRLEIHFTGGENLSSIASDSNKTEPDSPPTKLTATRVVATGSPVTIRAAAIGIGARAERIEYDCILQRVWLKDRDKVMLNDEHREVEARELRYTLREQNRLGDLWAQGPGIVHGVIGRESRPFRVTWRDEVQLQRTDNEPVLTFNEQVHVDVADLGKFVGQTVHLYLKETPRQGEPDRFDVSPDRLHAVGDVEVDSDNWHGSLQEAKIWFKTPKLDQAVAANPMSAAQSFLPSSAVGKSGQARSKFDLQAEKIEAVVFMGEKPVVDLLIVRGELELKEIASAELQPIRIRGNHFELQQGASNHPRAALLGAPAEIIARGLVVRGPKFHLHPIDNFLEIVGAGEMVPPAPQENQHSGDGMQPANIQWSGKMQFDGRLARFEQNVSIRGTQRARNGDLSHFFATGDLMHAELTEQVDFQNPKGSRAEIMEAAFDGWGFLQTEMFDPAGERKLFQQMQVLGLTVNQVTGDIHGSGPGWLRGIHRGKDFATAGPGSPLIPKSSGSGLSFLRVDFDHEITGNLQQERLEFLNGTKTLYGPVATWDDALDKDQPGLPKGAVQLTCDRLAVSQFVEGGGEAVELEAVGNAHIQGDSFNATGGRVSYVKTKDQFILEGDGRNDARIEFQPQPGARSSFLAAGKILFWPTSGKCEIPDLRQSELFGVGQLGVGQLGVGQLGGRSAPTIKPR